MNILPTKSWHVRNKKNIEKVRKDEAKAAEEEKEKQRKIAIAESEARSELLRKEAKRKRLSNLNEDQLYYEMEKSNNKEEHPSKHINFFEEIEAGNKQGKKNKEHELEIKLEKEKKEKEIGYLTYLGQNSNELNDTKPWYYESRSKEKCITDELEIKRKKLLDPLFSITKYVHKTEQYKNSKLEDSVISTKLLEVSHQKAPQQHRPNLPKTIEQLRAERLVREKVEKARQKQLLQKLDGTNKTLTPQLDDRSRGYNSRYNPQLSTK